MGVGAAGGDAGGVYAGTLGLNGIRSGAIDEYGGGWGFVEDTEAVFEAVEIEGDVVLEDVLEWGRIQARCRGFPNRRIDIGCVVCPSQYSEFQDLS